MIHILVTSHIDWQVLLVQARGDAVPAQDGVPAIHVCAARENVG